ncbi:dual specificity protein kinase TTK [Tribolium madens]|uniref:dual specificity protein kinase TTK n=1 Tax=Tribolium madens TaxID=41895 RepID=UPI001CF74884|nr:dual specificity protein kinase TTK [Tribolium madens]
MSSLTGDFSMLTQPRPENNSTEPRFAFSTIKRRQCQRRKFLKIKPLRLDEIQKEIEEAEHSQERANSYYPTTETRQSPTPLQDSFDLNFPPLLTPSKEPPCEKFVTPCPVAKPNFIYTTPKNKIPPKVQCSVRLQTPRDCDVDTVQIPPEISFGKIQVNDVAYTVLNELGKGGSSQVFHCFNPQTKSHRAIKVVSLENKDSAKGFINEVKMLEKLQKCNRIIKMFDYEIKEEEKTLLVVLEVGGTDLSKILKESALNTAHMPLYMLLYYWMEMLYAVKQIHSNGIVHSDLKPANFLEVGGYLKLIDFGISSCIQNDMTSVFKGVPEGSFNYISPEALSGETSSNVNSPTFGKPKYKISYKSDVWSLGCILYQLVYRRTPFQHITQIWVKLSTIVNPDHRIEFPEADWVPQKLINTIKKCLQRSVKSRPSIDELITEYENMFHSLV